MLLAGRGEPEAEQAERAVAASGAELTIVRSTWFSQNFSEDYFLDYVLAGVVALPAGRRRSRSSTRTTSRTSRWRRSPTTGIAPLRAHGPAAAQLRGGGAEIAHAAGRDIRYVPVPLDAFASEFMAHGAPRDVVALVTYLFSEVLDGQRPPDGRRPVASGGSLATSTTHAAAATGVWDGPRASWRGIAPAGNARLRWKGSGGERPTPARATYAEAGVRLGAGVSRASSSCLRELISSLR